MKDFRAFLLDLDGVIYRGNQLLPGAREFVEWIDGTGRKANYLSNNSFFTPEEVAGKLARLGMPRPEGRTMTAGLAAVEAIAQRFPGGSIYVLGTPSIEELARRVGLTPVQNDEPDGAIPHAVLVGLDRGLTYARLRYALRAVLAGAAFYAVNRDSRLPIEKGFEPGTGSIVAALEYSSGQRAVAIGKPEPGIVLQALRHLEVNPEEALMIGDGLDLDIVAGRRAGVPTALVLTGLTDREQAEAAEGERRPDFIFADLPTLLRAVAPNVPGSAGADA
jgi:HAD superfamily hydrolase (TIGR01450 family)